MKIYKIHVKHYAENDSHESIEAFLLANSDEEVYKWIDEKQHGYLTNKTEEDGLIDIYDDEYKVTGQETYKEKMLRLGGEYFDEEYEPRDLYYGATIYGWEKIETAGFNIDFDTLEKVGMLTVIKSK
jgi:hypothetical protein